MDGFEGLILGDHTSYSIFCDAFLDITLLDSQLYSGWLILGKVANASLGDFSMNDISYDELVKFNAFVVYKCST